MKKIIHDYKCQVCKKPARWNLQSGGYTLWSILSDGDFEKWDSWAEGSTENSFYCNRCYEKEMKLSN